MSLAKQTAPLEAVPAQLTSFDGVDVHFYLVDGPDDSLPVIFTHGGGPGSTSWNNFLYNARSISHGRKCYFVDLQQYGGSSLTAIDAPVFSFQANVLRKFMASNGIKRAHFVNQSYGSGAAIVLAAHFPELVASLVLMGAQPLFGGVIAPTAMMTKRARSVISDYYLEGGGPSLDKMRKLLSDLEFKDERRLTELTVQMRYEASIRPGMRELASTPGASGQMESLLHLFCAVKAPSLIMWGSYDWFGAPDVALLMLNQFANARLHIIGDAAHHLQSEQPEEFNAVVLAFLEIVAG